MALTDSYGNTLKPGPYLEIRSENPDLHYTFMITKQGNELIFGQDTFPPGIVCLSREHRANWSVPLDQDFKRLMSEFHGEPFLKWLDRQRTRHPELSTLLE